MITDYSLYRKEIIQSIDVLNNENFDYYISAYEDCERVMDVFEKIKAKEKIWLIFPQYDISQDDKPKYDYFESSHTTEDDYFHEFFEKFDIRREYNICVDITGFPRPHMVYLIRLLAFKGFKKIHVVYTEPKQYIKKENTAFSGFIEEIRIIPGCGSSNNNPITDNDVLIIGAGYDDKLISSVAQFKRNCRIKYEIFGFPSLQADMYQESRLKSASIRESVGENVSTRFAPAYDPFVTAELISNIISELPNGTNFYLSPLSSKAQALGFALYYCREAHAKPVNIIYPYSNKYLRKTSTGKNRTWRYTLEF